MFLNYDLIIRILFVFLKKSVRDGKGKEECISLNYTKCNFRRRCNFVINKNNHIIEAYFKYNVHSFSFCFVLALE